MKAHTTHLTLRHDERGLTLVEAMIALVVFSLGILAVVQLFPTGARSQVQDALLTDGNQFAQEKIDKDIQWKIRREATDNSQIMRTMHFLTDVYGPRLTGSPNLKAAQDWIVKETTRWGLKNAHLEPWSFGPPGWVNERLSVQNLVRATRSAIRQTAEAIRHAD